MESINELLNIYRELEVYKEKLHEEQEKKEKSNSVLSDQITQFQNSIKTYVTNPSLKRLIDVVVKNNPYDIHLDFNGYFISSKANIGSIPFDLKNLNQVAAKAREGVESIKKLTNLNDGRGLFIFCQSFNTLLKISNEANLLIHNSENTFDEEKEKIKEFLAKKGIYCESLLEFKDYIKNSFNNLNSKNPENVNNDSISEIDLGKGVEAEISEDNLKLAYDLFGEEYVKEALSARLHLALKEGESGIFINADINDYRITDFLFNVYFNFLKNLDGNCCELAACEATTVSTHVLGEIYSKLNTYPYLKFTQIGVAQEDSGVFQTRENINALGLIQLLLKEKQSRSILFGRKYTNIIQYNEANPNTKKNFILLVVNDFASTFNNSILRSSLLNLLKDSYKYGIYSILVGSNEEVFIESESRSCAPLNLKACQLKTSNIDEIDYSSIDCMSEIDSILADLDNRRKKALVLNTEDFLFKQDISHPDFVDGLDIPVGLSDGNTFNLHLDASQGPGGLILGKTRIGKSVFLHSLILSASYKYSPDEVNFYLSDFKGSRSLTFAQYIKDEGCAYIPHVRFVSLTNAASEASDLVATIKSIHDERTNMFDKAGTGSTIAAYNKKMRSEGKKTMPIAIFLIDEYISMLNANEDVLNDFNALLTTVAHAGIKIFFSGHSQKLHANNLGQISTRIVFDLGESTENVIDGLFNNYASNNPGAYAKFLMNNKGCAFINNGSSAVAEVRTSFPGTENSDRVAAIAAKVREKYPEGERQIVTGEDIRIPFIEGYPLLNINPYKPNKPVYVPLGFAASTYKPVSIVFDVDDGGKIVLGPSLEKQFMFEDVFLFSYLHFVNKEATYISFKNNLDTKNELLENHFENHPDLYKNLKVIASSYDVSTVDTMMQSVKEVERIYEIYQNRLTSKKFNDSVLLVVHQPSDFDLYDAYKAQYLENLKKKKNEPKVSKSSNEVKTVFIEPEAFTWEMYKLGEPNGTREEYEKLAITFGGVRATATSTEPEVVEEENNENEESLVEKSTLVNHLKNMFGNGSKAGVYVVFVEDVTTSNFEFLKSITGLEDLSNPNKLIGKNPKVMTLDTVTGPSKDKYTAKLPNGMKVLLYNLEEKYIDNVKEIE